MIIAPTAEQAIELPAHVTLIEVGLLTVAAVLLPLLPLATTLVSADPGYVRRYASTMRNCAHMLRAMARKRVIGRNLHRVLRGAVDTGRVEGHCVHCGNCCIDRKCVFVRVDTNGRSSCSIYGSRAFTALSCGQYPINAADISVYACPTFRALPAQHSGRRVIPIRPT